MHNHLSERKRQLSLSAIACAACGAASGICAGIGICAAPPEGARSNRDIALDTKGDELLVRLGRKCHLLLLEAARAAALLLQSCQEALLLLQA